MLNIKKNIKSFLIGLLFLKLSHAVVLTNRDNAALNSNLWNDQFRSPGLFSMMGGATHDDMQMQSDQPQHTTLPTELYKPISATANPLGSGNNQRINRTSNYDDHNTNDNYSKNTHFETHSRAELRDNQVGETYDDSQDDVNEKFLRQLHNERLQFPPMLRTNIHQVPSVRVNMDPTAHFQHFSAINPDYVQDNFRMRSNDLPMMSDALRRHQQWSLNTESSENPFSNIEPVLGQLRTFSTGPRTIGGISEPMFGQHTSFSSGSRTFSSMGPDGQIRGHTVSW